MQVPALRTPLTRDATAQALVPAYVRVFGAEPDRDRAELLLAQVWLENRNGESIIQRNIGNLSTSPSSGLDYWEPPWVDLAAVEALPESDPKRARYLALHERMLKGEAPRAFRAFPTFDAGFEAWLKLLATPRMQPILQAASSGDPDAFARATFTTGYCADDECKTAGPSYANLVQQIRGAGYFAALEKKKAPARARELPGLWFWCWGRLLSARTSGIVNEGGGALERSLRSGEP